MERIIITGALGQIGTELTLKLREKYGEENVLPTDINNRSLRALRHRRRIRHRSHGHDVYGGCD